MKDHEHGDASPGGATFDGDVRPPAEKGPGQAAAAPSGESAGSSGGKASDLVIDRSGNQPRKRKRRRRRKVFARGENINFPSGPRSSAAPPRADAPAGRAASPLRADAPSPVPHPSAQRHANVYQRPPLLADVPAYAALDLGTNNCRLLVAIPTRPGHFRVIDAFSRIVRLGEGLSASGRLSDAAMERALEALDICAGKLAGRRLKRMRLIATEACRAARNGTAFIERVRSRTGLSLEIIDRRTEARLAVSGCGTLVDHQTDGVVLFDIGGGSSEIALVDLSGRRTPRLSDHIVSWTSLPVGVVTLAERFGGRDVSSEGFEAMVGHVSALLENFEGREKLAHVARGPRFHLLGTSGTVTTLAGIHLELDRYDRRKVDGLWMERENIDRMIERLLGWDFDQRTANPCIGSDRADLVLAGCAILQAIRRLWPAERLRVADRGLREGMLSEMMAEDGVWRRRQGARRNA